MMTVVNFTMMAMAIVMLMVEGNHGNRDGHDVDDVVSHESFDG